MRSTVLLSCALGGLLAAAPTSAQSNADLARQVFVAESSFARTMAVRRHDAFASFIAPDAIFFGRQGALRGKAAVVEAWAPLFAGPDAPFAWRPEVVEVLESGTLRRDLRAEPRTANAEPRTANHEPTAVNSAARLFSN